MSNTALINDALVAGGGIVRLAPCWVPRSFLMPGGRLKLDPHDLYALGAHRGGIDERWFSSTTNADNGPGTPEDEGLNYIDFNGKRVLLKEAIETAGDSFLGAGVMAEHGGWNLLCKFFDLPRRCRPVGITDIDQFDCAIFALARSQVLVVRMDGRPVELQYDPLHLVNSATRQINHLSLIVPDVLNQERFCLLFNQPCPRDLNPNFAKVATDPLPS